MPELSFTTRDGRLPGGSGYRIEMPSTWNGRLLVHAAPIPVPPGQPPWQQAAQFGPFLERGYAVAGTANHIFWPLEGALGDQADLIDEFERVIGSPDTVIAIGASIGGIMTAGLVELIPHRLDGAIPMCGNLAGAVGVHNREFDMAFVAKHLLGAQSELAITGIDDPEGNLALAKSILDRALSTGDGRARLALVAAVGNIPSWFQAGRDEPDADDPIARLEQQVRWFREVVFLVLFSLRSQVEQQAGGNPSWNTDVDYAARLLRSPSLDLVQHLYDEAELDLDQDLAGLADADRIEADDEAVAYLGQNIIFSGELSEVPVLTIHTVGDGLVTPDNSGAYADVVEWAGQSDQLRQLWVNRGGHCSFTDSERLVALDLLMERIQTGAWPPTTPLEANRRGAALGAAYGGVSGMGADPDMTPVPPAFMEYRPDPFPRPYDIRMLGS